MAEEGWTGQLVEDAKERSEWTYLLVDGVSLSKHNISTQHTRNERIILSFLSTVCLLLQ